MPRRPLPRGHLASASRTTLSRWFFIDFAVIYQRLQDTEVMIRPGWCRRVPRRNCFGPETAQPELDKIVDVSQALAAPSSRVPIFLSMRALLR
jgi:hypothetical protein